ncbi:MAG: DUF309 domain-containing protein, partial [Myxococcota bacterium]
GHFYGRPLRAAATSSHLAWMIDPLWLFGVDLFHHRYWWEAHEVWEPLWRAHDKALPPGVFLQGLMQCAAALLKVHEGNLPGVLALWGKAEVRLGQCAKVERELWGLRTDKTFRAFQRYFGSAVAAHRLPSLDDVPLLELRL